MIKVIFWDNDGVLVDTEKFYYQANREVLSELEIDLTLETFAQISLKQGQSVLKLAFETEHEPELTFQQLREKRDKCHHRLLLENLDHLLIPNVKNVLQNLSKDYSMGIVTSSPGQAFEIMHRKTKILRLFDFILTREDYIHTKPDPEPYLKALDQSGYKASECLVVEDTVRGLHSAIAAKLKCVCIPSPMADPNDFSGATAILNDILELPDLLGGL